MNMMRYAGMICMLSAVLYAIPLPVSAHVTGASWETPAGTYTSDIGYDPVTFTAGVYTRFDFSLWNGTTTTDANGIVSGVSVDFSQVWIRIINQSDQETLLATGIWKQPVGPTTLLYEFTAPGTYKLEASYRDKDGNDIAVASQSITVEAAPAALSGYAVPGGFFIIGLAIGAAGYALARRSRRGDSLK
jgi:hypothetical protein